MAYLDTQPLGSAHLEQALALLLAAIHNGLMPRKNKRAYKASEFMVRDPWAPKPSQRRGGPSLEQIKAVMTGNKGG